MVQHKNKKTLIELQLLKGWRFFNFMNWEMSFMGNVMISSIVKKTHKTHCLMLEICLVNWAC